MGDRHRTRPPDTRGATPLLDGLARDLAEGMPRRRALKVFAGAIAAVAFPSLRPTPAAAIICNPPLRHCDCPAANGLFYRWCCAPNQDCKCTPPPDGGAGCECKPEYKCGGICCEAGGACADADLEFCCEKGTRVCRGKSTVSCCKPGEACCNGRCCDKAGDRCYKGKCGKCPRKKTKPCGDNCCEKKGEECCGGNCCNKKTEKCCFDDHCCPKKKTCCGTDCCGENEECCNKNHCCAEGKTCCGDTCCDKGKTCVESSGGSSCCPNARVLRTPGGVVCCPSGSVASGDRCCPSSNPNCQTCDPPCNAAEYCNYGYCVPRP
jgi:hypothetical protein